VAEDVDVCLHTYPSAFSIASLFLSLSLSLSLFLSLSLPLSLPLNRKFMESRANLPHYPYNVPESPYQNSQRHHYPKH
jgi:hypothetical protein